MNSSTRYRSVCEHADLIKASSGTDYTHMQMVSQAESTIQPNIINHQLASATFNGGEKK